ncbi:MAG: GNAT family N-acetyltransferase [Gammaproteobacteria bacterium]
MITYREAEPSDAKGACAVLIESINTICAPFYNDDKETISKWLENKTPANVRKWIESENTYCIAAEDNENNIVGFSCISGDEIMLLYVVPEVLYKGVGKHMLARLESYAHFSGITEIKVLSSLSAKAFYERNGYVQNGDPQYVGHILGDFPLIKNT